MLRQVCQSYIQPVKGKFLNTFFSKSTFLFFLCFGAKTIRTSGKIFRQGFQNSFLCVQRTIWEIKKWTKTFVNFIITSDFKQKSFRILAKFFARLVKSVFYLSGIKFLGKNFFRKVLFSFFEYFYSLTKTVSGVLAENNWQACRNSIPCVKRNVLKNFFSGKKIRIFKECQKLDGRIFDFNQKFPAVSSELQPTCPEECFD